MKTIEDMLQQLSSSVSSWWKEQPKAVPAKKSYNEQELWGRQRFNILELFSGRREEHSVTIDNARLREEERKYSAESLLGKEKLEEITSLRLHAYAVYDHKQSSHEQNILIASDLFIKAANVALTYVWEVKDVAARNFLIKKQVMPSYGYATSCYSSIIQDPKRYQAWHPLTIDIFRRYLELKGKLAALDLLVGRFGYYESNIQSINNINYHLKKNISPEQAGLVFIEAAVNAQKTLFPDILVLQLYNFALENLQAEFYGNNPSAQVKRLYKFVIDASMTIATKSNDNEVMQREFARLQQELRIMQDKLDIANIVRNELESNPSKTSMDLGLRGLNDEDVAKIVAILNLNPYITALSLNRISRQTWVGDETLTFKSSELQNVFGIRGFIHLARLRYVRRLELDAQTNEDKAINTIINDNLPDLRRILAELARLNQFEDMVKVLNNLLLVATVFGRIKIVNYLLTSGVDIRLLDAELARAAMFSAIYAGHGEVVLLVLNHILANEEYFSLFQEAILTIAIYMGSERLDSIEQFLMPVLLDLELRHNLDKLSAYLEEVPSESKESKEADDFEHINRWIALSDNQHRIEILVLLNTVMQQLKGLSQVTEDKGYKKFCQWQELINSLVQRVASKSKDEPVIFSDYTKLLNNREALSLDEAAVGMSYYQLGVELTKLKLM